VPTQEIPPFSPDLVDFWRERHLCTVSTLRADGSPHVVPMGIVLDAEHARAWGITSGASQKVVNLRSGHDPRIAVCQVAVVCEDEPSVAEAVRRYAERYRQPRPNPARVAIRIELRRVLGNVGR
jgi:F420H(2)-dependent biliverdin reductase